MAWRKALRPAPSLSMSPFQRIASQTMAMATQKNMIVVMLSLMESMQYCEKTTTKTIGRKGRIA